MQMAMPTNSCEHARALACPRGGGLCQVLASCPGAHPSLCSRPGLGPGPGLGRAPATGAPLAAGLPLAAPRPCTCPCPYSS